MSTHAEKRTAPTRSSLRLSALLRRWWVLPLVIYAISRVVGGILFAHFGADMTAFSAAEGVHTEVDVPANAGYPRVLTLWDGQWYWTIADHGYPTTLPQNPDGTVAQNPWAFYPVYPGLVRLTMTLTGLSFPLAASTVSLVAGAGAILLLYRLLRPSAGELNTLLAIAVFCAFPAAPILQAAYAESVTLLLLLLAFLLLRSRRYGWYLATVAVLSVTRPLVLPLALVVAWHWWTRWRARDSDPFPRREQLRVGAVGALTAAAFGIWPLVAAIATGVPSAFLATHAAWADAGPNTSYGSSWLLFALTSPNLGVPIICIFIVIVTGILSPTSRHWGTELRAWGLAYSTYLVTVARPTSSIIRYGLLLLIWWPFPFRPTRRIHPALGVLLAAAILTAGFITQYYWLHVVWLDPYDLNPAFHLGCCVP